MRHLGFTGTRHGMTDAQLTVVDELLKSEPFPVAFHHGDCIGADAEAHKIALAHGHQVHVHPPTQSSARAYCTGASRHYPVMPYLDRNRWIVELADMMIGTPAEMHEQQRGGTWSTIRYARRAKKRLIVVYPDGTTEETP